MITPTLKDVHLPFGPLFILDFLGMVNGYAGLSAIIERCTARRTIEVDMMNRWHALRGLLRDHHGIDGWTLW
jgi:hypothetical protein